MSEAGRAPKKAKTTGDNVEEEVSGPADDTTANNCDRRNLHNSIIQRRREKESLILQELSTTLHTIQNISSVLDDIVHLTTLPTSSTARDNDEADVPSRRNNVMLKERRLLNELQQWKHLLPAKKHHGDPADSREKQTEDKG